ncbi:ADP-ribosylation factor 5C isoform X2 [Sigmodon hispidus]
MFTQEKVWSSHFPLAWQFVILVIDSTNRNRLLTTREELYKMLAHEALQDASVLIFANKQGMKDSMTTAEISQFLTLGAIKDHPWHIQGCCALTGEGLPAGLRWLQSQVKAGECLGWEKESAELPRGAPRGGPGSEGSPLSF